jgi:hypothetical protein
MRVYHDELIMGGVRMVMLGECQQVYQQLLHKCYFATTKNSQLIAASQVLLLQE